MPLAKPLSVFFCVGLSITASMADAQNADKASTEFHAEYQVYLSGLKIADATIGGSLNILTYEIETSFETRGMVHMLQNKAQMTARTQGENRGRGRLAPTRYRTEFARDEDTGTLTITYDGHTPSVVTVPPVLTASPSTYDPSLSEALGPLSALLSAMWADNDADICNRTIPVFDGTRRYDIFLLPEDRHPDPKAFKDLPLDGPILRCFGVYDRISGFDDPGQSGKRYYPFDIWFEVSATGLHRIARIAGQTKLGHVVVLLRP